MYASSIFGWLSFLQERSEALQDESPVSASPLADAYTEASREGLLEFTEILNSLLGSVVVAEKGTDDEKETIRAVLEEMQSAGIVREKNLDPEVIKKVKKSPRYKVLNGFVIVQLNVHDNGANVLPVVTYLVEEIEQIVDTVTDILKFLDADDSPEATSLSTKWRQIGGTLCDLHQACVRLVQRIHHRERINDTMKSYAKQASKRPSHRIQFTND